MLEERIQLKKSIWAIVIVLILGAVLMISRVQAVDKAKVGYLIVSNNCCIIVRSPNQQFISSVGRNDVGIILKDNTTRITINGGYLAIAVPLTKIEITIMKYHLDHLTRIE